MFPIESSTRKICTNEFNAASAQPLTWAPPDPAESAGQGDSYSRAPEQAPLDTCAMMRRMGMACADPRQDQANLKARLWQELAQDLGLEVARQVSSGIIPVAAVINLAEGLYELGKAGKDGRELAQRRSFVSGYLTTLGHGMDMPRRTGVESHQRALKDPTYLRNRELARGSGDGLNSRATWRRQWQALAGQFEAGASDARQLLEALPLEGRRQVKAQLVEQLQGRVDPADDSFVGYLKGWLLPQVL